MDENSNWERKKNLRGRQNKKKEDIEKNLKINIHPVSSKTASRV